MPAAELPGYSQHSGAIGRKRLPARFGPGHFAEPAAAPTAHGKAHFHAAFPGHNGLQPLRPADPDAVISIIHMPEGIIYVGHKGIVRHHVRSRSHIRHHYFLCVGRKAKKAHGD